MAKPATRKGKKKTRGKSQNGRSPRDSANQNPGAQPNTQQKAPIQAAPHPQGAEPNKKEPEKPFIVRSPFKIISWTGGCVTGIIFGGLLARSLANTHGPEGAAKIASATILPLIVLMCLMEVTRHGSLRASALGAVVRAAVISLIITFLIVAPYLWRKTGYEEICWHVFLGGVAGYVLAFFSWVYLAVKRDPWLMQRQYGQWAWFYRFSASVLILIGGWIGVIVRLEQAPNSREGANIQTAALPTWASRTATIPARSHQFGTSSMCSAPYLCARLDWPAPLPCPAAVAVHDQPDVPGQRGIGQFPAQLA